MSNPFTALGQRLRQSNFTRSVASLAIATAAGQGVGLLAAPILTRLYTPEAFGSLASFTAITGVLAVAANGRYDMAIVLPETDEEAVNVVALSVGISLLLAVITTAILTGVPDTIAEWFGGGTAHVWLWVMPLSLLLSGMSQALNYWVTRKKEFRQLGLTRFAQAGAGNGVQVALGAYHASSLELITGQVGGQLVGTAVLGAHFIRRDWKRLWPAVRKSSILVAASKYRKFPVYTLPNGLLNILSQQLPGFLFPVFFGNDVLGRFYLAQRMFYVPISFIGQAFDQVFYQRIAENASNGGVLKSFILKSYGGLAAITFPVALGFAIVAPLGFEWVFGTEWRVAGEYLRILLPWLSLKFVVSPSTAVFSVLGKQDMLLFYEITLFAGRLLALLIGALALESSVGAIALYSVVGVAGNVFLICTVLRMVSKEVTPIA